MLSRYGYREWMGITIIASALAVGAIVFTPWPWIALIVGILWLALILFFRDPPRRVPRSLGLGVMLSPADGRVTAIEYINHHESTGGPAVLIRIFLSVLNVHVNRAPHDGEVIDRVRTPGEYINATKEDAAGRNESLLLTLRVDVGSGLDERIGIRQISGMIARRIVCAAHVGDVLRRGEKYGMIKFGSTTELTLPRPDDVEVVVASGDRVKAGVTVLARLKPFQWAEDG